MSRRTWSFIAAPLFLSARPWGTHAAERYPLVDGEVRARRTPAPHDASIGGIDRTLVRVSGTGPVSGRRSIFGRIAHRLMMAGVSVRIARYYCAPPKIALQRAIGPGKPSTPEWLHEKKSEPTTSSRRPAERCEGKEWDSKC